jgi:hypothetical protein
MIVPLLLGAIGRQPFDSGDEYEHVLTPEKVSKGVAAGTPRPAFN